MRANMLILLRREPADLALSAVLRANTATPPELIIDLDEIVVAQDGRLGLDAPEKVGHALLQLLAELRHVPARVDLGERHQPFVLEAPEAGEQDAAGYQVVLSVCPLEHDGEVVLDEAAAGRHGVFGEGPCGDVEGFVGVEVGYAEGGFAVEGWVAGGEVVAAVSWAGG